MAKKRGNGEGSIGFHKKSGLYMARYPVHTPTGTKRKAVYGKTRREVDEKLTKAKMDRDIGLAFDAGNLKVGEYLSRWLPDGDVRLYSCDLACRAIDDVLAAADRRAGVLTDAERDQYLPSD